MRLVLAATILALAAALPVSGWRGYPDWTTVAWIPFASPPVRVRDIVLNMILYLPLGVAVARARWRRSTLAAAAFALPVSALTELVQVYSLKRFPSTQDVVCNVAGAAAGALLIAVMTRPILKDQCR